MHSNINEELKIYADIPRFWNGINGYQYKSEQYLYDDGWRSVVIPEIAESEKLGQLIYDEVADVVTYEVLDKTPEEIAAEKLNHFNSRKSIALQELTEQNVIEIAQTFEDRNKQAEFAEVYPMWEPTGEEIEIGTKLNGYDDNGNIVLYKSNQAITATPQFEPRLAVYAFDKLIYRDGFQVWQQPQAHNLYQIGDIVWFEDELYVSIVDNNAHSPDAAPQNWENYEQ